MGQPSRTNNAHWGGSTNLDIHMTCVSTAKPTRISTLLTQVSSRNVPDAAPIPTRQDALLLDTAQPSAFHVSVPAISGTTLPPSHTAVSRAPLPTSSAQKNTHPSEPGHYHVPATPHTASNGYVVALVMLGIAVLLIGIAACCLKFSGKSRLRTKKSTRPVEVITMTPHTHPRFQTPHREAGHYAIGGSYSAPTDVESQKTKELEQFRRYQRLQAEQAMGNAYTYNSSSRGYSYNANWRMSVAGCEYCWRCMKQQCGGGACPRHSAKGVAAQGSTRSAERAELMRAKVYRNSGWGPRWIGSESPGGSGVRNENGVVAPPPYRRQ